MASAQVVPQENEFLDFLFDGSMDVENNGVLDEKTIAALSNGTFLDATAPLYSSIQFQQQTFDTSPISSPPSSANEDDFSDLYAHLSASSSDNSEDEGSLSSPPKIDDFAFEFDTKDIKTLNFEDLTPFMQTDDQINMLNNTLPTPLLHGNTAMPTIINTAVFSFSTTHLPDSLPSTSAFNPQCSLPPLPEIKSTNNQFDSSNNNKSTANDKNNKTARKRRTGSGAVSPQNLGNFTELSEEELMNLDSQQIEVYIKNIHAHRNLSVTEDKELKRIRRLIKNREYAQSSRNKKRQHVEQIEGKVNEISEENQRLKDRVVQLESENRVLRGQLSKISSAMKNDPVILERLLQNAQNNSGTSGVHNNTASGIDVNTTSSSLFHSSVSLPSSILNGSDYTESSMTNNNKRAAKGASKSTSKRTRTTAVSLFVVMFAFGLFLQFPGSSPQSSSTISVPGTSNQMGPSKSVVTGRFLHSKHLEIEKEPTFLLRMSDYLPTFLRNWLISEIELDQSNKQTFTVNSVDSDGKLNDIVPSESIDSLEQQEELVADENVSSDNGDIDDKFTRKQGTRSPKPKDL